MLVTFKPRNNHPKTYEVSGKGELLHDRQIDIILEMVTALKTKFMLRKYLMTYFTDSISKQLQLVPPDSTSTSMLLTKLLTAKRDMAGAELAACSMEPGNQSSWMRPPQTSTPLLKVQ